MKLVNFHLHFKSFLLFFRFVYLKNFITEEQRQQNRTDTIETTDKYPE